MAKVLFTIGYEGVDPERVTTALRGAGVATLADVRAVAASRKRGVSKTALAAGLPEAGIACAHLRNPWPFRQPAGPDSTTQGSPAASAVLTGCFRSNDLLETSPAGSLMRLTRAAEAGGKCR